MSGLFARSYEVWRKSTVPDGGGGFETAWAKVADVKGRASASRRSDEVVAAQRTGVNVWTFATAAGTDLRPGDEIRFDGRVLTVTATAPTSTGRRLECQAEEIQ